MRHLPPDAALVRAVAGTWTTEMELAALNAELTHAQTRSLELLRYQHAGKTPPKWEPLRIEHPDRPGPEKPKAAPLAEGLAELRRLTGG